MKCEETTPMLDSLLDSELPTQTTAEILAHIKDCGACADEWESRLSMRDRMHSFRQQIPVPAGLCNRIEQNIRRKTPAPLAPLGLAAAAAALIGIAVCVVQTTSPPRNATTGNGSGAQVATATTTVSAHQLLNSATTLGSVNEPPGFEADALHLEGWNLASTEVVRDPNTQAKLVRMNYTCEGNRSITCYQAPKGAIVATGLEEHKIGNRTFCCGQVGERNAVFFSKNGRDYLLAGTISQNELMGLAQGT